MVGATGFEPATSRSRTERSTKLSHAPAKHQVYHARSCYFLEAMPLYEYECKTCGNQFEQLVRTGDVPACPSCKGQDLTRLLSLSSVSSENTRQLNFNKARARAKLVQRDKDVAQAEYEKKHREEGH
jgi:putative FmdB family regulatory protein